jgi:hypothetical protein
MPPVEIFPLVPRLPLPVRATGRTRSEIPPGYGVQEQCLPFVAAAALGVLVPSPISFGLCLPEELPAGAHAFRSPLDRPGPDGCWKDPRVFYVADRRESRFMLNAYTITGLPARYGDVREPGLSFFDRPDQMDLVKLHLPYIWRTPPGLEVLFLPLLNRPGIGFEVLSGLVETDWYANPVNLALRKPVFGQSVHVAAGDPIAQAIFVSRDLRQPETVVMAEHSRAARRFRAELVEWYQSKAADRSAYRRLARQHQSMIQDSPDQAE